MRQSTKQFDGRSLVFLPLSSAFHLQAHTFINGEHVRLKIIVNQPPGGAVLY